MEKKKSFANPTENISLGQVTNGLNNQPINFNNSGKKHKKNKYNPKYFNNKKNNYKIDNAQNNNGSISSNNNENIPAKLNADNIQKEDVQNIQGDSNVAVGNLEEQEKQNIKSSNNEMSGQIKNEILHNDQSEENNSENTSENIIDNIPEYIETSVMKDTENEISAEQILNDTDDTEEEIVIPEIAIEKDTEETENLKDFTSKEKAVENKVNKVYESHDGTENVSAREDNDNIDDTYNSGSETEDDEVLYGLKYVAKQLGVTSQTARNYIKHLSIIIPVNMSTGEALLTHKDIERIKEAITLKEVNKITWKSIKQIMLEKYGDAETIEKYKKEEAEKEAAKTTKNSIDVFDGTTQLSSDTISRIQEIFRIGTEALSENIANKIDRTEQNITEKIENVDEILDKVQSMLEESNRKIEKQNEIIREQKITIESLNEKLASNNDAKAILDELFPRLDQETLMTMQMLEELKSQQQLNDKQNEEMLKSVNEKLLNTNKAVETLISNSSNDNTDEISAIIEDKVKNATDKQMAELKDILNTSASDIKTIRNINNKKNEETLAKLKEYENKLSEYKIKENEYKLKETELNKSNNKYEKATEALQNMGTQLQETKNELDKKNKDLETVNAQVIEKDRQIEQLRMIVIENAQKMQEMKDRNTELEERFSEKIQIKESEQAYANVPVETSQEYNTYNSEPGTISESQQINQIEEIAPTRQSEYETVSPPVYTDGRFTAFENFENFEDNFEDDYYDDDYDEDGVKPKKKRRKFFGK